MNRLSITTKSIVLLALATIMPTAFGAEQRTTDVVRNLQPSENPRPGYTRLRIRITSNETAAGASAAVAGITACSAEKCFTAASPSSIPLFTTDKGLSALLVELEVPFAQISEVSFKSVARRGMLAGTIKLPSPLVLTPEFQGGEILVVTKSSAGNTVPIASASNYIPVEGTVFYYNPTFSTSVSLPMGVQFSLPAGALASPQIFIAAVHDTGDPKLLVSIFPNVKLAREAVLNVPARARRIPPTQSGQPPASPAPRSNTPLGGAANSSEETGPSSIRLNATGTIRAQSMNPEKQNIGLRLDRSSQQEIPATSESATTCNAFGWCNCPDQLAFPSNQQIITQSLAATGTTYLNWCTTITPQIHIAISNLADSRERFTIKSEQKVLRKLPWYSTQYFWELPLRRITQWSPYTQVMVNGFSWQGDYGFHVEGYGRANGYVGTYANTPPSRTLGMNQYIGGACTDFYYPEPWAPCQPDNQKRIMFVPSVGAGVTWASATSPQDFPGSISYVSSSTSVVRDGVCSTDTETNRWSAVGATSAGRLVFISTTTEGRTSSSQLCPVFLALGVTNAIRLDGGSATAMTVDGILKNPLDGIDFIKTGSTRYLAYTLKVSYPGW